MTSYSYSITSVFYNISIWRLMFVYHHIKKVLETSYFEQFFFLPIEYEPQCVCVCVFEGSYSIGCSLFEASYSIGFWCDGTQTSNVIYWCYRILMLLNMNKTSYTGFRNVHSFYLSSTSLRRESSWLRERWGAGVEYHFRRKWYLTTGRRAH